MRGNIPTSVTLFSSGTKTVKFEWDDLDESVDDQTLVVTPAFPSDSSNEKTCDTGRTWARNDYWGKTKKAVKESVFPNTPIGGIRIVGLERRSEGGRAYKVVTPDNYYFDFREDVLLDTMLSVGVSPNGVLNGEFIWGKVGSQMKLIRVGSRLHSELIKTTEAGKRAKIPMDALEVGGIYTNKSKDRTAIFLGFVNTVEYISNDEKRYWSSRSYRDEPFQLKTTKEIPKAMLWLKYDDGYTWSQFISRKNWWMLDITQSHAFIEKVGTMRVPAGCIAEARQLYYEAFNDRLKNDPVYSSLRNPENRLYHLCYYSKLLNMGRAGDSYFVQPEFQVMGAIPA